jgi:hypothetical protein
VESGQVELMSGSYGRGKMSRVWLDREQRGESTGQLYAGSREAVGVWYSDRTHERWSRVAAERRGTGEACRGPVQGEEQGVWAASVCWACEFLGWPNEQ